MPREILTLKCHQHRLVASDSKTALADRLFAYFASGRTSTTRTRPAPDDRRKKTSVVSQSAENHRDFPSFFRTQYSRPLEFGSTPSRLFSLRLMFERSKLESLRDVGVTRIGDTLSYGFLQTDQYQQHLTFLKLLKTFLNPLHQKQRDLSQRSWLAPHPSHSNKQN